MPKYSYKCLDCENKFTIEASIQDKEERTKEFNCPQCKSKRTKQVFALRSFFSKDKSCGGGCCSGGCK